MNRRHFINNLGMVSIVSMLPTPKTEKKLLINRILHDATYAYKIRGEKYPDSSHMYVGEYVEVIPDPSPPIVYNDGMNSGVAELLKYFEASSNIPQLNFQISRKMAPDYVFDSIEDADKFLWKSILEGNIYGSETLLKYENHKGFGIGTSFRIYANSTAWRGRRGHAQLLMGKDLYEFSKHCMTVQRYIRPHPKGEYESGGDTELFECAIELNDSIPDKMIIGVYTGCQKWDGVGNFRIKPDGKIEMALAKNWKDHMFLLRYE